LKFSKIIYSGCCVERGLRKIQMENCLETHLVVEVSADGRLDERSGCRNGESMHFEFILQDYSLKWIFFNKGKIKLNFK
jgi:hypothetical protein